MRSCVDLPDPSEPSTMMRVPGRSSVEKNISFCATFLVSTVHSDTVFTGVFGFFEVLGVGIGEYYLSNICKNRF